MNMTPVLSGHLLVASSLVTDPIYAGGVCLVMHQDETQTIGVMLNRPLRPTPEALLAMFGVKPSRPSRLQSYDPETADSDGGDSASPDAMQKDTDAGAMTVPGVPNEGGAISPWRMIHFGGPLSGPVVAIHPESELAEAETGAGIYVAAQKQHLENLVRQNSVPYRLIVGHLGWKTEHLEFEIASGLWHVVPATVEAVFAPAGEMWPHLVRRATSNSLAKWIGVPDNPRAFELN